MEGSLLTSASKLVGAICRTKATKELEHLCRTVRMSARRIPGSARVAGRQRPVDPAPRHRQDRLRSHACCTRGATGENRVSPVILEMKTVVCANGWFTGMSPLRDLVEARREQVKAVAARHHAGRVRLFGSVARGDERPDSDIDLLVDFTADSSLFDLMRMTRELEDLLGRRVDIVSAGGLKDRDRDILAESVDL